MKKAVRKLTQAQVIEELKMHLWLRGDTQKYFASVIGISPQYLSDIIHGKRRPCQQILDALGLEHVNEYQTKRGR